MAFGSIYTFFNLNLATSVPDAPMSLCLAPLTYRQPLEKEYLPKMTSADLLGFSLTPNPLHFHAF